MRRALAVAMVVGAGAVFAASGWKAVLSGVHLAGTGDRAASAWAGVAGSPARGPIVLRPAVEGEPPVDLSRVERSVVFVFDPECGPCNANMPNWIDLIREIPADRATLVAVGFRESDPAIRYWTGLHRRVRVTLADTAEMRMALGVTTTPTTLLVEQGRVVRQFEGLLGPAGKGLILHATTGEPQVVSSP